MGVQPQKDILELLLTSSTYELLLEGYLGEVGLFVMRFHEITLVCLSLSLN